MTNPYIIIALLVVWLGSVAGVGAWQNNAGHTAERLTWEKRANVELSTANSKIKALEDAYRLREQMHAVEISSIDTQYTKELQDAKTVTDALIVRARNGDLRLHDPYATANAGCGNTLPEATTSTGQRDGETRSELPKPTTEFLLAEAGRADEVVKQLDACQQVMIEDRSH
jgi:prophage endopeptidase